MTSTHTRFRAASEPLKVALFFGLLAGAARALQYLVMRMATNDFLWTGDLVIWLAPPGHVALFSIPALLLAITALISPRLVPPRLVATVFAALAFFSFLLLFPRIHHLASLVLGHWWGRSARAAHGACPGARTDCCEARQRSDRSGYGFRGRRPPDRATHRRETGDSVVAGFAGKCSERVAHHHLGRRTRTEHESARVHASNDSEH